MPIVATNRYDKIYKYPVLDAHKMPKILEHYAQKLYNSGLLRISAAERCNFVILPVRNGSKFLTFTKKELFEKKLISKVKREIHENLSYDERKDAEVVVDRKIAVLQAQVLKYIEIPDEWEIKIARAISQCIPPVIFANLVLDKIEIFVSFSHTISDLLNVQLWKTSRTSQGLQSTSYDDSGIFISTGGNPFFDSKDSKNEYDGRAAMERLMIIGAQEIAHWSEIIKNKEGKNVSRFSCDYNKPNELCEAARQADLKNISLIEKRIEKINVEKVYNIEQRVQVKKKYRNYSIDLLLTIFWMKLNQALLLERCRKYKLLFVSHIKDKYIAQEILSCVADMKFNVEPNSVGYLNQDEDLQKAVYCAEALARVPQQKVKWGNKIAKFFSPNLNEFYNLVIKQNKKYFELKTGKKFKSGRKTRNSIFGFKV